MRIVLALVSLVACSLFLFGCARANAQGDPTITIRYSHFNPSEMTVRAGEPVTFTLRNEDPIAHEWIVGTADVHARHRTGTEPYHDQRPSEVTVPALSTRVTTLTFREAGDYQYICHLPGHEEYGMVGVVHVVGG